MVPTRYFDEKDPRCFLSEISVLAETAVVGWKSIPAHDAVLVYSGGGDDEPELYKLILAVDALKDYFKIGASIVDGELSLVIVKGTDLLFANVFDAPDFTTAQYYIFAVMKSLQLNPEVSTIYFRQKPDMKDELSICSYFNSLEVLK